MDNAIRLVTLTERDLEKLLARAVTMALAQQQQAALAAQTVLSPRQVARLAKIRDKRVYDAITSGQLAADQDAAGRYRIRSDAATAWIDGLAKYRA